MTPAINSAKKRKISYKVHQYNHDPNHDSYGIEAVEKLEVAEEKVYKTLVVQLDNSALTVAIIPVTKMLSLKLIAKAAGAKKATMADKNLVEKTTGYLLGGVSPLGQKKRLATFIDLSALDLATMYVSAGRRGLEIELKPSDLAALTSAKFVEIQQ